MRVDVTKTVNLPKLHMEMLAANLIEPTAYFGEQYFIAKDDADVDLIQQIIDAHDPTPIPPEPTKQEIFEQQITANTDYLLDVDFRLILVELGMF